MTHCLFQQTYYTLLKLYSNPIQNPVSGMYVGLQTPAEIIFYFLLTVNNLLWILNYIVGTFSTKSQEIQKFADWAGVSI